MAKSKWISVTRWRELYFEEGDAPARNTVIRMIEDGELPGRRLGNRYYINQSEWERQTNAAGENDPLVQMVMNG